MSGLGVAELFVILIVVFFFAIVLLIPYFMIFKKAGFSPWLCLLMVLPVVNLVMLYLLAFMEWPSLKQKMPPPQV